MDLTVVPTPAGPFTIVADDDVVLASGWSAEPTDVVERISPTLRTTDWRRRDDLGDITKAVHAYLEGDVAAIDTIPVRQVGGPFLRQAWEALRDVLPGHPVSYSELAARCGQPAAVRAAANACARNAPALFVPCHRALRADGSLGGYRWGLDVKQWLLDHEAAAG